MLGFLSHTNTIQIHLYSSYLLHNTNTNTIRVHSSGIQIHQSINWSINQLVHTQYNHSLQIISIKFIHSHLTQNKKKQMMAQTWLSRLAIVCLFIFLSHLCFETEEQTNKYDRPMVNLFPRLEIVGRVGWKRRKVFVSPNWCLVVSSRNFLWFSSSRETETRKFVSRSVAFLTVEVFACFPQKKKEGGKQTESSDLS